MPASVVMEKTDPTRTGARRLSKALFGLIAIVALIGLALVLAGGFYQGLVMGSGLVLTTLAWATVGTLMAGQIPRNPIGWLLSAGSLIVALTIVALGAIAIADGSGDPGAARAAAWFVVVVPLSCVPALLIVAFLYFPDGTPAGRWARAGVAATVLSAVLSVFGFLSRPEQLGFSSVGLRGPSWTTAVPAYRSANGTGGVLLLFALICAAVSVAIRYRRAAPHDRQAMKWVIRLVIVVALLPALLVLGWIGAVLITLVGGVIVLFALPGALLVAVLRSQLFEVELVIKRTLVIGAVVLFVAGTFVVFVGFLASIFAGGIDPVALVPALVIAFGIGPVRRWAQRGTDRLLYGERATPYEVLSDFSERVGETYSTEDVLPRMVQLLAAGTGATEARVWIRSGGALRSAAVHPAGVDAPGPVTVTGDELPAIPGADAVFPVEHGGALLGALTLTMARSDPMDASKERLARDLASQAGLVLLNVALIQDLRESRRRIVTAQDERARKLERDIHDGAQQQLVALSVKLRLAQQLTERDPAKAAEVLGQLQGDTTDALENLRDLARGIYPPLLADQGLVAALEAQARKATVPVEVEANGIGRFGPDVEAAVYFSCLEALQNTAKYASATRARIALANGDGTLTFEVTDDGRGFDPETASRGSGLQGIEDRLAALGGRLTITSVPGEGVTITGRLPVSERHR